MPNKTLINKPNNVKLSEFIAADIQNLLSSNSQIPFKLSLISIADHYQASITPVRQAVQSLVEKNVLTKSDTGRLTYTSSSHCRTNKSKRIATPRPAVPKELDQVVAEYLIKQSLLGDLGYVREESTARKLGLGRTTLRHTFSRLAGRGVLQHHPRKGWIVTPVNLQDLEEYIEIREALEITALKRSFHLLKQDVLMSIRNGNVPGSSPRLDNSLHQYIVATSNNKYIADFFERYGLFFSILMDHAAPETQLVSEMASQHNCIIESILANDLESAITHLRDHIRSQIPIVTKLMQPKHFEDSNSTHDTD